MRHKEWKMGTMVEKIQPVGPPKLLNNMVKVFANTGNTLPPSNLRTPRGNVCPARALRATFLLIFF